ncbi:MAG: bifunctional 5,10-methylenetetrahydrofolate dehydrogenase/5,10-methenyltetrahydrofolate cyclohydrolase [Patescibacteria group bacterium]|jgi:methylenetetrahydrofolate dehydrogenase (NADP+)/methenyltetrahydrofolate cyclohydrolase
MQRIPGKQIAQEILDELKDQIRAKSLKPKLGVLLVGEDPASALYVSLKRKAADEIGVLTDFRQLSADTPDSEIIKLIKEWNVDKSVNGILIQMPVPEGHDADALVQAMDPQKDSDGFHPANVQSLENGEAKVISPLHEGILRLIAATPIEPNHSLCIILANTHTFADPLKYILERAGATVEVMLADHKDDKRLREADVIVVAVGKEKFLTSNGVKPGACVIDVGINKSADNKVRGDFDSEACADMEGYYSPVPGGVGPMTVALLMKNVVEGAG